MRVLLISHFFPPTHTAGTEQYTLALARGLQTAGHDVQVLCAGQWAEGNAHYNGLTDEVFGDIPVRRLHLNWTKAPDPNRYLYQNPVTAEMVRRAIFSFHPDLVHVTSCYSLSASILEAVKAMGLPLVVTLTDFWFICPRHTLLRGDGTLCDGRTTPDQCLDCLLAGTKIGRAASLLPESLDKRALAWISSRAAISSRPGLRGMALDMSERKRYLPAALEQADLVIAPSRFLADMYAQAGVSVPMVIVPYLHDLDWLAERPERSTPQLNGPLRFVYIGQIAPLKGVHVLAEAWTSLPADGRATLAIWGDIMRSPAYAEEIKRQLANRSDASLMGPFAHHALGQVLSEADIVVVPSTWYENNPLVIQEAFAAGLPVVATNLGGMAEFVDHEVNGLLFAAGDARDLALQLSRMIEDPGLVRRLQDGIPPVKPISEGIDEVLGMYRQIMG